MFTDKGLPDITTLIDKPEEEEEVVKEEIAKSQVTSSQFGMADRASVQSGQSASDSFYDFFNQKKEDTDIGLGDIGGMENVDFYSEMLAGKSDDDKVAKQYSEYAYNRRMDVQLMKDIEGEKEVITGREIEGTGTSGLNDFEVMDTEDYTEEVETVIVEDGDTFVSGTEEESGYGEFTYDSTPFPESDPNLYLQDAKDITGPMLELMEKNAELQKQGIDDIKAQRQLEFDFMNKKQYIALAQMQSKQNIPASMRGQQFNQLMLNQFVEMSEIYTSLDLQKLNIDNEMTQFKVAMEERNYELANEMYDKALMRASIQYDITGEYIPPELDFMYSQLDYAENILSSATPGSPEYDKAMKIKDEMSSSISKLGMDAEERKGYVARKDAYSEWLNGFDMYITEMPIAQEQYRISSQTDTRNALTELNRMGVFSNPNVSLNDIYDILEQFPYADYEFILGSSIDWEMLGIPSPTGEDKTLPLLDIMVADETQE